MTLDETQKPEFEEWLYWANVIADRLANAIHIYSRPDREDIFMPAADRQIRNGHIINLRTRIHALTDETEMPSDSLIELDHHAERVIDGLVLLFGETLEHLPQLSHDMQKLAKSPWHAKSGDRLIDELFHGPMGDEQEGIGSGYPEHGRLPQVISRMLIKEQNGDGRSSRHELFSAPHRTDNTSERWTERNSRILRSAGRID